MTDRPREPRTKNPPLRTSSFNKPPTHIHTGPDPLALPRNYLHRHQRPGLAGEGATCNQRIISLFFFLSCSPSRLVLASCSPRARETSDDARPQAVERRCATVAVAARAGAARLRFCFVFVSHPCSLSVSVWPCTDLSGVAVPSISYLTLESPALPEEGEEPHVLVLLTPSKP